MLSFNSSASFRFGGWVVAAVAVAALQIGPSARAQERLLQRSGDLDSSLFGDALAAAGDLDGDGHSDLIVGAPFHDPIGLAAGRVLVLSSAGGGTLHDLKGPTFSMFGDAVAGGTDIDGDLVPDFLVSAPLLSANGPHSGRVALLSGADASELQAWSGEKLLTFLGDAVAFAGDLDGDGTSDVLAGAASFDGTAGGDCGKLYAWTPTTGVELWSFEGAGAGDGLGSAITSCEDVDGDGVRDVAVGASLHDGPAGADSGAIYLLSGADGTLIQTIHGSNAGDELGASLSSPGDVDQNGIPELLAGAPGHNGLAGSNSGVVHRLDALTGGAVQSVEGDEPGQELGRSVSVIGDANGDGVSDFAAGAPFGSDGRGAITGAAILFDAAGTRLHKWIGKDGGGRLGASLCSVGDWNGDARDEVVVAAPDAAGSGVARGEVLVDGGTALFLASDLVVANAGETITLTTRAGTNGRIGLLAIRDVDAVPLFMTLFVTFFDAAGSFELSGDVPSGLGGLDVGLQSFGQGPVRGTVASGLTRIMLN